ncbi:MAG TPA: tripartite tricarboxylate transporter substrate binding protein [Candidatus Deferrimicrobiaceae bacterium]
MKRSHIVAGVTLLCLAVLCAGWGTRQAWSEQEKPFPTRQITYMVCFDPGGQSDREARRQQPLLEKYLGQKVIIDYKIGGGGALGWRELAAKAKPDGYTIAGFNIPHVILQPLQQDVGYKTDQIVPVFIFHKTPLALAVLQTSPYQTMKDLIEHAKKNPGAVTVGGSGTFSGYHMATLRFEKLSGTKLTYVPFTGAAPQMTSFLGGHVVAVFGASDDLTRYRDKVRVLGFATEKRFPGFPDAPTLKEQGIDMVEGVDRGIAVPPGTPSYAIRKLESAFKDIASKPEFQEEQRKNGFVPMAIGHEEAVAYVKKMTALYTDLAAGLKK